MILEKSRKGPLTARINNKYIHSRYDPEKEAAQLVESFTSSDDYSLEKTVIVIEPGLGYILRELNKIHSDARIVILFLNSECYKFCKSQGLLNDSLCYQPDGDTSFDRFIKDAFSILDIRNILFLEMPSTVSLFRDRYESYQKKILDQLSISQGSLLTQNHFALRWILNSFKNFINQDLSGQINSIDSAVILTASGPSLENHITEIKRYKDQYIIAALPSSLAILKAYGIIPDILFTTDPGFFAREHLRYLDENTIIVSSIISSLDGSVNFCCGINQKSYAESLLLKENELNYFPEMGTVAATALFYLMNLTKHNIYIAGLDFCMDDIKMHAQPHSFTPLIIKSESRFEPGYCAFYKRSSSMTHERMGHYRLTKNMNTYTSWFKQQNFGDNVFRLTPAFVKLPIPEKQFIGPEASEHCKIQIVRNERYPSYSERCKRLNNLGIYLNSLIEDYETNQKMSPPLAEFVQNVFPSFKLNKKKDRLESDILLNDLLYKIRYLIDKIGCISNG